MNVREAGSGARTVMSMTRGTTKARLDAASFARRWTVPGP